MKKWILTLLACTALGQANALLPPLYQGSTEIKAILADPQLGQKLSSGDVITKIEKTDRGYLIVTNKHRLEVTVDYEPAERPGPAQYVIRFGKAETLTDQ
jgi:hypothetical protein